MRLMTFLALLAYALCTAGPAAAQADPAAATTTTAAPAAMSKAD